MIILPSIIRQRTAEWYTARLGKFTASHFSELMAKPADRSATWSKSAINYIQNLALQLYLNEYTSRPDNDATRWGVRYEDKALKEFGSVTGFKINESGFLVHPEIPEIGATPDAFIIEDSQSENIILAQVKCPFCQKNHLKYSRKIRDAGSLKKSSCTYHWQIQGEIWVTGASHSYFVSYDPRLLGSHKLHYAKIERDQQALDHLESVLPEAIVLRNEFLEEYRNGPQRFTFRFER
jgi:predicted phage-related endonuclease